MSTIANRLLLFIFVVTFDILHSRNDFKPFDDTVLYKLSWNSAEHMPESLIDRYDRNQLDSDAVVLISTGSDERYLCTVPEAPLHERPKIEQYQVIIIIRSHRFYSHTGSVTGRTDRTFISTAQLHLSHRNVLDI